jgi:hypothetical protein
MAMEMLITYEQAFTYISDSYQLFKIVKIY